ncbi:MAG: transcription elongation factor GreA [Bdellovibrionota bacterium]
MSIEMVPFTKDGYASLSAELNSLKTVERPKVIEEIAEARSHGDLKENAEYHAAREKQGFIEARINDLEDKLARAQVVDYEGQAVDTVKFGAFVTLEDEESSEKKTYRIVGDLEADIEAGKISVSSPIAKALMGKELDDVVEIKVPKGIKEFVILDIRY